MQEVKDATMFKRHWEAGGGYNGKAPIRSILPGEWRPGMPCHWTEQTRSVAIKIILIRIVSVLHLVSGIVYLQYRARKTIGVFEHSTIHLIYQFLFFFLEVVSYISLWFRFLEIWNIVKRNSVNFNQIPLEFISLKSGGDLLSNNLSTESRYPSIGIFIPCYNEEMSITKNTVIASLNIDYPEELLSVYLCDDGKDPAKAKMINQLKESHKNVFYCTRPEHRHAKAGNLNFTLRKTESDLVVIFDADFVARPNFLQRLVPYFFVWNPDTEKYELNKTLAAVQTPQQFRNLSPTDSDPFDQRQTGFSEIVLPGKDWFNACPLIGTANLLSRSALKEAGYFPCKSVTEDSEMSMALHRLGYRTYYVNESLAHGLATTSLWSNFNQRERWLKGDWQVFFSTESPLRGKGLSLAQICFYLFMSFGRLLSIIFLFFDIASILLLVFGITMLDVTNVISFFAYYGTFIALGIILRIVRTSGGLGLEKSESAGTIFEVVFRFEAVKGLLTVLTNGKGIKFKVTEKSNPTDGEEEVSECRKNIRKNLQKVWINIIWAFALLSSIAFGILRRSIDKLRLDRMGGSGTSGNVVPLIMSLAFAISSIIPHCLVIYICFVPYLTGSVMKDYVHDRCDQFETHPVTGKRFVPRSYISLVNLFQVILIMSAMTALITVEYSGS